MRSRRRSRQLQAGGATFRMGCAEKTMRKMRKQPIGPLNAWNWSSEPGERRYQWTDHRKRTARMFDLRESHGWGKRTAGVLTEAVVKKSRIERIAKLVGTVWYWLD
jgi:hypothetical protein